MLESRESTSLAPDPKHAAFVSEAANDSSVDVLEIVKKVRKHWVFLLAVWVLVFVGTVFFTLGQKKYYQSSATILFDPNHPRPLGRGVEMVQDDGNTTYVREYVETQLKMITSMRVALAVVRDLGLDKDGAFIEDLPRSAKVPPVEISQASAAKLVVRRTEAAVTRNTFLATVRYSDADPERTQRITAAIVDAFIQLNMEDMQSSTGSAVEWLNSQLDKLKTGLESSEMALHHYKIDKNILSVDIDSQSNMLRDEMRHLNDALTATRIKREEVAARNGELMKVKSDDPVNLPATELLSSIHLSTLRSDYINAKLQREAMVAAGKGANHPEVLSSNARVESARNALLAEVRNIQGAVARDLTVISRQEGGLSKLYEVSKKQALDLNLLEIEYKRLWRSKENNEKLYGLVLERAKETDLTRMLRVNNIRVIDRPLVSGSPVSPRIPVNLAIGAGAGVLIGLLAVLLRDKLDRTIKTALDVEGYIGIPVLGILPLVGEAGRGGASYGRRRPTKLPENSPTKTELLVHEFPKSGIAEAARAVRTSLQFMTPDRPLRTLLVTSANPGEGKTTVACAIATALAQAGNRVLLIDCDMRRPRVHRIFDATSEHGLSTLLAGSESNELIAETVVPGLSILVAGPIPPNPSELLQTERFRGLLEEFRARFDRVVIDSPPILPITDASVIATQVDGLVLVARAGKTTKEMGKQACRTIQSVGGRVFGCVLNAIDLNKVEYKYYYYQYYKQDTYGYGYGYGQAERTEKAVEPS